MTGGDLTGHYPENHQEDEYGSMDRPQMVLASILNAIPHAVLGLKNRTIIFANPSVKAVFGWEPEALIGKSTRILYRTDQEYEEIGGRFYPTLETYRMYHVVISEERVNQLSQKVRNVLSEGSSVGQSN